MSEIINLPISNITQDPEIQIRATSMDWLIVDAYIESAKQGAIFPPVVVFFDGDNYWLADGNHRLEVARRIGQEWIDAEVKQGGKRIDEPYYAAQVVQIVRTLDAIMSILKSKEVV